MLVRSRCFAVAENRASNGLVLVCCSPSGLTFFSGRHAFGQAAQALVRAGAVTAVGFTIVPTTTATVTTAGS